MKNTGVSEAIAMDIIGHESREISQHYTHIESDAKREALDKLPDVMAALKGENVDNLSKMGRHKKGARIRRG